MGRKRTPEVDALATRERILETAERLFRKVGYSKTTVADVASRLRMSPSNVYRYFPTKSDINREICSRIIRSIESRSAEAVAPEACARDRVKSFVLAYHRSVRETIFNGTRLHDMVSLATEQHWDIFHRHAERVCDALASLLARGVGAGELRDLDVPRVARAVQNALVVFIYPQLLEHLANEDDAAARYGSLEEQLLFLVDTLFDGIGSRRPQPE